MYQCVNRTIPSNKCPINGHSKWRNSVYVLTEICHQRSKWLGPRWEKLLITKYWFKKIFFQTGGKLPNSIDWYILLRIDENGFVVRIASNNSERFKGNNFVSSTNFDEKTNSNFKDGFMDNEFNLGPLIFPEPSESITEKVTSLKDGRFVTLGRYKYLFYVKINNLFTILSAICLLSLY